LAIPVCLLGASPVERDRIGGINSTGFGLCEMSKQSFETRQRLINAACQLFGEYEYNDVSTRMIAEKAQVNLGGIHYYFGSKENLYEEVLKVTFNQGRALTVEKLLEENPSLLDTPAGKSHAIYQIVLDLFKRHFVRENWKRKLILRELFEPSPLYLKVLENINDEQVEHLIRFYFMLAPHGTFIDACTWIAFPDSLSLYHLATRKLTERILSSEFLEELYQNTFKSTIRAMILLLDLPVPDILK
jgi:AcrR family transcriptional regulator